jgi:hypothetical protein
MIKVDTQVIKPSAENVKRTEVVRVLAILGSVLKNRKMWAVH